MLDASAWPRSVKEGDPRMNMKDWLAYAVAVSLGLLAMILIVGLR